jgi:chaperonin GroES
MIAVALDRDAPSPVEAWEAPTWVGTEASFEPSEPDTARMQEIPMKIRPLQDHVIVKRSPEDEHTKGGLIIPDTAKEKPLTGIVIAVGKGKLLKNGKVRPPVVKAGDRVVFVKYAGAEARLDGEEYLMLREDDMLGVLEE